MFKFLGVQRIDFTNRETGEKIKGYSFWFAEPADSRGVGYVPFKKFFSDEVVLSMGGVSAFSGKSFTDVNIVFGHNGRVISFDFV